MVKINDFASDKGVTVQAIYKHIAKHREELDGHVEKRGKNGTWLDAYACQYISDLMLVNPVVVSDVAQQQEIERLKEENKKLLIKVATQADNIAELAQWKAEHALAIAEAKQKQLLLEERTKKAELLENTIKKVEDKLHLAEQRAEQLEKKLEEEKNKGFFARLFGK